MKKERKEAWFRILVAIVTGIILSAWGHLIVILAIIHWFIMLFGAKRNKELAEFMEYWNSTSYQFYVYLTGMSNKRPFPFSPLKKISKFER